MRFGRSWGKEDLEHARRPHRHQLHQQQIKRGVERKSPKPQKWQRIGTKFDMNSCRLLFGAFMYLGCWCIGTVCEENDTDMEEGEGPRGETALTNNNHGKR